MDGCLPRDIPLCGTFAQFTLCYIQSPYMPCVEMKDSKASVLIFFPLKCGHPKNAVSTWQSINPFENMYHLNLIEMNI
ncbi:hypothetical protein B5C09_02545 [Staphylococcus delphini]|nr:hypothetical protein B5C09_02545 [Staphylococcus delphini]PCF76418.1 hypothetical protein B4W71_00400 [Staphylococcus delphini]